MSRLAAQPCTVEPACLRGVDPEHPRRADEVTGTR